MSESSLASDPSKMNPVVDPDNFGPGLLESPDKPEEACGVFGIYGPGLEVAKLTYFGLYALQHRGQESAGIATFTGADVHLHKDMGLVSQVFDESTLQHMGGTLAVGHTRYSTTGSSRIVNAQPVLVPTPLGPLALAHNGNLVNTQALRQTVSAQMPTQASLISTTDSEVMAWAIANEMSTGKDWISGTIAAMHQCEGAFSVVMGTPQGLVGIRDSHGIRPLVIGILAGENSSQSYYVLASETCALDIIGAEYVRDVQPGELIWIDDQGLQSHIWSAPQPKLCIFEMIYFARPDSWMEGTSLYSYRQRLGQQLGQESAVPADLVIAVPDSGVPAAIGYSQATGVPYAEGLIKNRYVGRTFIQPTQAMREAGIRMKLNPLKDVLEGKRVVIVDDSIVRGTTSRKIVRALREAGATEVHMRISSPPVTHPCFYGIDTDNQDQLIAATKSVAEISEQIGVDSLSYLTLQGMIAATQAQEGSQFCSACFTGNYPITIPDPVKRSKLVLEKSLIQL